MAFFHGLADALAHMGLAQQFTAGAVGAGFLGLCAQIGAQGGHGLGNGGKQRFAIAALFHGVVPPALAIGMACGLGQPVQRVAAVVGFSSFNSFNSFHSGIDLNGCIGVVGIVGALGGFGGGFGLFFGCGLCLRLLFF